VRTLLGFPLFGASMLSGRCNPSESTSSLREALEDVRACENELQTFLSDMFDRIERLAQSSVVTEPPKAGDEAALKPEAMQCQIEQLAALAAELAASVAEQKKMVAGGPQKSRRR
jgi:hypothetical protein